MCGTKLALQCASYLARIAPHQYFGSSKRALQIPRGDVVAEVAKDQSKRMLIAARIAGYDFVVGAAFDGDAAKEDLFPPGLNCPWKHPFELSFLCDHPKFNVSTDTLSRQVSSYSSSQRPLSCSC